MKRKLINHSMNYSTMKNVALLLCCVLLLCNGCKYFKKSSSKMVDTISRDTVPTAETIDSAAYYSDIVNKDNAGEVSTQPVAQHQAAGGNYYMIVGCFTVQANADKYAEKLRAKGYDVNILPGRDNFQMVSARSYGNYRESISEIDKFRNDVTPNAWVYLKK
jgi:uncharacterized ParB-like nuclease family protein